MQRNDKDDRHVSNNDNTETTLSTAYQYASSAASAAAPYASAAGSFIVNSLTSAASTAATSAIHYASQPASGALQVAPLIKDDEKKPRDRTKYSANHTAALALPDHPPRPEPSTLSWLYQSVSLLWQTKPVRQPSDSTSSAAINRIIESLHEKCVKLNVKDTLTPAEKKQLDNLTLEKINLVKAEIRDHAARRTDLFFYLCVTVFNTNIEVIDGRTIWQHGTGSKSHGTHACHSTLFSNPQISHLQGTHFLASLNMTVELPSEVNEFDKHLEGLYSQSTYVKQLNVILNRCAKGEINPQQAMTEYMRINDFFFELFNQRYLYDETSKGKNKMSQEEEKVRNKLESFKAIWQYQKEGTFKSAVQGKKPVEIDPDYIEMMLGRHTIKNRWFQFKSSSYKALQAEIIASPSTYKPSA